MVVLSISNLDYLKVTCWMVTGERQATRIRNLYLKTILRQEIGFFDKETNTGEVVGRMSGDTVFIQDAMGEKMDVLRPSHWVLCVQVASFTGEKLAVDKYSKSLNASYKASCQEVMR
ncbi:unnamed protein product [Spirodela intermedia]|uniref:ABC transmembrane type-1 domain-containing protein n=1 Tax=Spirodela intermedia TaxID=51605 RepID=A0A7I8JFF9_SPIIN|nr:unnamed protein product [Spirodela intermedia]CAA6668877.1 unnamed protein product [Spirodela intermedia]